MPRTRTEPCASTAALRVWETPRPRYRLGELCDAGEGRLPPDECLSAAWLYQSAQQGHVPAIERIAELGIDHKPGRHPSCILSDGRFADYNFKARPARGRVAKLVRRLAPKYKLDPNLVLAVIEVESGFDVRALSPKNAQGLMQIIPETASRFGVRNVWDAEQNVRGGMAYLRWLIKNFSGDARLALAAYNAVERAVERHGGVPPYEETRSYVERILRRLQRRKTACDAPPKPAGCRNNKPTSHCISPRKAP